MYGLLLRRNLTPSLEAGKRDSIPYLNPFYNFERPHGALAGQTPYERLRQATRASV